MKTRSKYYDPPACIRDVPGIIKNCPNWAEDTYTGTAEALVQSGVLTMDLLPGQPGRGLTKATYRPRGSELPGVRPRMTPNSLTIFRMPSGLFKACLVVSVAEQDRRRASHVAAKQKREAQQEEDRRLEQARQPTEAPAYLDPEVQAAWRHFTECLARANAHAKEISRRSHLRLVWPASA